MLCEGEQGREIEARGKPLVGVSSVERAQIDHRVRSGLVQTLEGLIDEQTRGDGSLRCAGLQKYAGHREELDQQQHPAST